MTLNTTTTSYLTAALARGGRVQIVSGEGDGPGTVETYDGHRTTSAIRTRLREEQAGGDRWAYALIEARDPGMIDGYAVRWDGTNRMMGAIMPTVGADDDA